MSAVKRFAGVLLAITAPFVAAAPAASPLPTSIATSEIVVDVAIIGAGAGGGYAAVRLKEDLGKSIAVIDKGSKLGGHVSTYDDPIVSRGFDFGVNSYNDYGPARAFMGRLGVPVSAAPRLTLTNKYVDFKTGLPVAYSPAPFPATLAALQKWLDVVEPFESYLLPGYFNFPSPASIPSDLLLPFGEFVEKYQIHAAVNFVFSVTGMGTGDMKNALTMYVLSSFGTHMIKSFLGEGVIFTPDSRRNIEVYEKIQTRLEDELLLSSTVIQSQRSGEGHILWVKNHVTNAITLVRAERLLIAIEPTKENMAPFALDTEEKDIFSRFRYQRIHAGIVSHPALPVDGSVINVPAAAAPTNYLELPQPNFDSRFEYMGYGSTNWRVLMVGDEKFDKCKAQSLVKQNFRDIRKQGSLPAGGPTNLEIKAWADHGAMHMHFSAEDVRAGYIQKLYGLQGKRGTWWTGGAFAHQFQAVIWAYDDILLEMMFA